MSTISVTSEQYWNLICDLTNTDRYCGVMLRPYKNKIISTQAVYEVMIGHKEWIHLMDTDDKFILDLLVYEFLKDLEESES